MSTYLEINKIILSCAAWAKTSFSKDSQRELKIPSEPEQQDMGNLKRGGKEAKHKMPKNEFKARNIREKTTPKYFPIFARAPCIADR